MTSNPGPPVQLFVEGGDNGVRGSIEYQIAVPVDGGISFDWGYQSTDALCYDAGGYSVNGVRVQLACTDAQVPFYDGATRVSVKAGDVFGFWASTIDGIEGAGVLGVTGFKFGEPFPPEILLDPQVISSLQPANTQATLRVEVSNIGGLPLDWHVVDPVAPKPAAGLHARRADYVPVPRPAAAAPVVRHAADCAAYRDHAGAEPAGYAEHCGHAPVVAAMADGRAPQGDVLRTAHALDLYASTGNDFVVHPLDDLPEAAVLGQNARPLFAMDFDPSATTLYAVDDLTRELGTVDLATGAFTPHAALSGVATGSNIAGLAVDPASGQAYLSTAGPDGMTLYALDLETGAGTFIGNDPERTLAIDIAIGPQGVMYAHDVGTDAIYSVDRSTGLATLVGPTGVNANFTQSMDFDNADGALYAYMYFGGGSNAYGTIDLASGAFTPLSTDMPQGEFTGATRTTLCEAPSDIPWLSLSPASGSLPAGSSQSVDVQLDSTGLAEGKYVAAVCFAGESADTPLVQLPVRLTVGGCLFADGFETGDGGSCGR